MLFPTAAAMAVATFAVGSLAAPQSAPPPPCPYHQPGGTDYEEDHHLIVFQEHHTLQQHIEATGVDIPSLCEDFIPVDSLPGYRCTFTDSNHLIHEYIRKDPGVQYVEQDMRIDVPAHPDDDNDADQDAEYGSLGANSTSGEAQLAESSWHLEKRNDDKGMQRRPRWHLGVVSADRQQPPQLPAQDRVDYHYWADTEEVDSYVFNGGIMTTHEEFNHGGIPKAINYPKMMRQSISGRIVSKYCRRLNLPGRRVIGDTNGHGTHVAGLLGGYLRGVAKNVMIYNVKVDCANSISTSGMINALEDVIATHRSKLRHPSRHPGYKGAVINVSLWLPSHSPAVIASLDKARRYGIPIAVATENKNVATTEAQCDRPGVVCVGGVDKNYRKANPGAWGTRVKIVGPGERVNSASKNGNNRFVDKSGSSMATPIVSGVIAQIIGKEDGRLNTDQIIHRLINVWAVPNVAQGYPGGHVPPMVNNDAHEAGSSSSSSTSSGGGAAAAAPPAAPAAGAGGQQSGSGGGQQSGSGAAPQGGSGAAPVQKPGSAGGGGATNP